MFYRLGTGSNVGRIVQVDVQRPGTNTPVQAFIAGLKYTALNQPRAWYWLCGTPNACDNAGRSFNADGRMTGTEFSYYGYDAAGRLNRVDQYLWTLQDAIPASGSNPEIPSKLDRTVVQWSAGYDSRDRLTSFARTGASSQYSYDANSNRLSSSDTITSSTDLGADFDQPDRQKTTALAHTIAPTSNRLLGFTQTQTTQQVSNSTVLGSSSTQVSYQLDAAGNLTSDGLRQFGYDAANRLSEVKVSDSDEASKVVYLHNALGQRVFKSEPQVAQTAPNQTALGTDFISWLQQSFSWLFTPSNQSSALLGQSYVYGESSLGSYNLLGEYGNGSSTSPGSTEYIWLPTEGGPAQPIGLYRDNRFYGVHSDHLGTPRLITDDSGKAVWQWSYSAFGDNKPSGVLKATPNPNATTSSAPRLLKATTPAITVNLRFAGQYWDEEAKLSYNYMRSYRAAQGRYDQFDPTGLNAGPNGYIYAEANPFKFTDPKGLSALPSAGVPEPAPASNMSRAPWATPDACSTQSSSVLASNDSAAQRKTYCLAFCQYELDMPGRFDNFGPHRACIRRCMAAGGFTM